MNRSTVYIVDDDDAVRRSLELWLRSLEMDVMGFPSGEAFLGGYREVTPACLVMDLRMPDMNGLEVQARMIQAGVRIPTIFLTGHATVPQAVEAMENGAVDFIEKPFEKDVLLERIRQAHQRDSSEVVEAKRLGELRDRMNSLTPRQREVLDRVVQGKANKVIALDLDLSEKTIELHRAKMMKRMAADSLADLVKMWVAVEGKSPGG